jgi:hypothetical protein
MAIKIFLPTELSDYDDNANALSKLAAMYKNTFTNMLETLLIEVKSSITSPKDSQLLYSRIIESMLKMAEFNLIINGVWNPVLLDSQTLNFSLDEFMSDKEFRSYVKKEGFNVNLFRSYITKINRYYMNFNEAFPNNRYFLADNWSLRSRWPPTKH